ncbi:hypothetical protein BZG73_13725 [Salinivibrio siamensis]|uniref:Uncharacterized protein n=1 Tax=Salinivibrio siamensis TaxID=414286 RepID=A0ABX3K5Y8_9GAMM|nr:hypothetical protein [Salinivibrio siamensis]OOE81498.1 hypothetical protein BZG73_13725 [Salinivibrio siamensis]
MRKTKAISLIVLGGLVTYFAINHFTPQVTLDKKVLDVPVSESVSVVGYRNNVGGATIPFRYHFYVRANESPLTTPFLISGTPDVDITARDSHSLMIKMAGEIYQFTNVVWVKDKQALEPIHIQIDAQSKAE